MFLLRYSCVYRANSEIAQVRGKAKQEQAAYQASLRKEQMKVDSLERTLEQKVSDGMFVDIKFETHKEIKEFCINSVTEQRNRGVDKDL